MADNKTCPHCGKPVPPTALGELCPECLLKAGLATQTEGPGAAGEPAGTRFVAPPVGEIARLFPQLEILRLIGQGGMGAVYKARQPALDRFVALKVLPPAAASDPGFAERFNREARALARLNHPNIVAVHDFGKAGTLHYLVMEFVDGANLREIERLGELTPEQALAIVPQICEALQFAHNEGIVHRDIKPENLLLDKRGRIKITDFGIAKMVGVGAGQQTLTGAKDVVGTPHYMAPEQIEKPLSVDHRADIYSLGVVFYEMLTGELPLGKFQPPSSKVQIDVRLDEVVLHALEKEPNRRYQQASQVKTAVETIVTTPPGGGPANRNEPTPTAAQIETARNRLKIPGRGLIAAGVLQLLFALGLLVVAMPAIASEGGGLAGYAAVSFGAALLMLFAAIVLFGATSMMKLRRYSFSAVASVVATVAGPGALLGLPFGIWACVELIRPDVRSAFAANRQHADQARLNMPPAVERSDYFWRFIVIVFVVIPVLGLLGGIAIKNIIPTKSHTQFSIKSDYIGQAWFPQSDSIEITSVERTPKQMVVKGNYKLVSHDQASLALYITATIPSSFPEGTKQTMPISRGQGDFELIHPHLAPGLPHVSMYADGHPFASLYFGTREEAAEESKAGWTTNVSSASTLQFRLVLPQNSTVPADWLPSASSSNQFHLSRQILLDDMAIAQAGVDFNPFGMRTIEIRFTDAGAKQFEAITATNIGNQLAIVFGGRVLSAPIIQSVIAGGQCQVSGSMNAGEANEIVDCLNRVTTSTAAAWNFSPVQERILPSGTGPDALFGWLDLDTGTVLTNSTLDWQTRSGHDWIQTHGLDVVTTESAKHFPTLLGFDMIVAPAPTNGWDTVTAADVVHNWAFSQDEPRQMRVFGAFPGQSDTFFFQTRKGGKGILQILGFAGDPPGMKVRYKLLQSTTNTMVNMNASTDSTALNAVNNWLSLIDGGNYGESWESASDDFHDAITKAGWVAKLEKVRQPLGKVVSRTVDSTNQTDGSHFEARFNTAFANFQPAAETVMFSLDNNGRWKAWRYLIFPAGGEKPEIADADKAAVSTAKQWLTTIDRGRYSESWSVAADVFRDAITQDKWVSSMEGVRKPLGGLVSRHLSSAQLMTALPGAPDGKYVVMEFGTSFENEKSAVETVTFMLEKDGTWKAAGYYIK